MASPFGVNIRQNPPDKTKIVDFMVASGGLRSAVVQLYDTDVSDLNLYRPHVEKLIWRTHMDETLRSRMKPNEFVDSRIAALDAKGIPVEKVWIHTHNEAGFSDELIEWECDVVEYGVPMGCKFVSFNTSVGTPESHDIPRANRWLKFHEEHPEQTRLGLHLYWQFPEVDIPWYHGRYKDWWAYCDANGIRRPLIISTESGQEGIVHGVPDGFWSFYAGRPNLQESYASDIILAWEKVLSEGVESINLFTWGDFGKSNTRPWHQYDVSKAPTLLTKLSSYGRAYQQKPEPEKPWNSAIAEVRNATYVNVRSGASITSQIIGSVYGGDPFSYREFNAEWYEVRTMKNVSGFASRGFLFPAAPGSDSPPIEDRPTSEVPKVKWMDRLSLEQQKLVTFARKWSADPFPIQGATDYKIMALMADILDGK